MFNSVCGEQQPHPARHEAGTEKTRAPNIQRPQGTGPPGEPPQGQPRPPPRKGQRRARRRDPWQPQCRRPRVPWRQARRLHRQSTTPGRTGPWARRPKGPPPHNRGPARPVGPGPANRPLLVLLLRLCLRQWSETLDCSSAVHSLTAYVCIFRRTWSSLRLSVRNSMPQGDALSQYVMCVLARCNSLCPHKAIKRKC